MLETRDPIFRFVDKLNEVVATSTTSPPASNCVSFSNDVIECAFVEPPYLATIKCF